MVLQNLWYPVLGAASAPQLVTWGTFSAASTTNPQTVPLNPTGGGTYTTQPGDCLVVFFSANQASGCSGAGMTWNGKVTAVLFAGMCVGWGSSGGQASFSLVGAGTQPSNLVWAVFRNVRSVSNPQAGSAVAENAVSPVGITFTPALGQLAVAGFGPGFPYNLNPAAVGWSLIGAGAFTLFSQTGSGSLLTFENQAGDPPNTQAAAVWLIPAP